MIREDQSLEDLIAERIAEKVAEKVVGMMPGNPDTSTWLEMKDAAAHIKINYQKFTELVRRGEIPAHRYDGCIRINRRELDNWMMGR